MILTHGLTHIRLTVSDLEGTQHFYQQLLGMKAPFRFGLKAVMLQTPGTREIFTLISDPEYAKSRGEIGGIAHFGFRLEKPADMNLILEEVIKAGGTAIEHGTRGEG